MVTSLSNPVKDTRQTISAFALIVFLISGVALSGLGSWFLWTSPKEIGGLGFVQNNIVLAVTGAYILTFLLINLMGWLGLGWPWKRQDLIRVNLIFIGILLGWVAVVFWVSVTYGFMHGPNEYIKLFVPLTLFTALGLLLWAAAFLLPEKVPSWLSILFLLVVTALLVPGIRELSSHLRRISNTTAFFPEMGLTLLVSLVLIATMLSVLVLLSTLEFKGEPLVTNISTRFGSLKPVVLPIIIWIMAVIVLLPTHNHSLIRLACIIPLLVLFVVVMYHNMRLWFAKKNRPEATAIISLNSLVIGLILLAYTFFLLSIGRFSLSYLVLLLSGLFLTISIFIGRSFTRSQSIFYSAMLCLLAFVAFTPRSLFTAGHYKLREPSFFSMVFVVLLVALSLIAIWLGWYRDHKAKVPWHSATGKA